MVLRLRRNFLLSLYFEITVEGTSVSNEVLRKFIRNLDNDQLAWMLYAAKAHEWHITVEPEYDIFIVPQVQDGFRVAWNLPGYDDLYGVVYGTVASDTMAEALFLAWQAHYVGTANTEKADENFSGIVTCGTAGTLTIDSDDIDKSGCTTDGLETPRTGIS